VASFRLAPAPKHLSLQLSFRSFDQLRVLPEVLLVARDRLFTCRGLDFRNGPRVVREWVPPWRRAPDIDIKRFPLAVDNEFSCVIGGSRTLTPLRGAGFEPAASTSSSHDDVPLRSSAPTPTAQVVVDGCLCQPPVLVTGVLVVCVCQLKLAVHRVDLLLGHLATCVLDFLLPLHLSLSLALIACS